MKGGIPLWKEYTIEQLQDILKNSLNRKDFMIKLGYGGYRAKTLRDIKCAYPELDFSHFTTGVFQDLTGQRFGRLTVLHRDQTKKDAVYWVCKCDCGNVCSVIAYSLKTQTLSCGCLLKEARYNKIKDLTGQRFNRLTVIKRDYSRVNDKRVRYWCQCDCGKKGLISVLADNLKRGHTTSCGCTRSKGETKTYEALEQLNIEFQQEKSLPDLLSDSGIPLRFDFIIYRDNKIIGCIECQGQQHYFPLKVFGGEKAFLKICQHDIKKKLYCQKNKLFLLSIPYYNYSKINKDYLWDKLREYLE